MLRKHYVHWLLHGMTWFRIADERREVNCRTGHELIEKWVVIIYFMTWFLRRTKLLMVLKHGFWCSVTSISSSSSSSSRVWRKLCKERKEKPQSITINDGCSQLNSSFSTESCFKAELAIAKSQFDVLIFIGFCFKSIYVMPIKYCPMQGFFVSSLLNHFLNNKHSAE